MVAICAQQGAALLALGCGAWFHIKSFNGHLGGQTGLGKSEDTQVWEQGPGWTGQYVLGRGEWSLQKSA